MSDYDNTNSGALFKNDKKESERHPDYRGSINVEGKDFWLSCWLKTSKNGQKFMSLAVTPKDQDGHNTAKSNGYAPQDVEEDLPF